jgi:hypothetical protein
MTHAQDGRIERLLALQGPDGNWGVGVYDADDWSSTTDALWLLHELDASVADKQVRSAVARVHAGVRWDERNGGRPFFQGETEACVNGRVLTLGARFGHPDAALVERLLQEQLEDGGWNCAAPTSTRGSFHSTICVLEGLLAVERATGADAAVAAARHRGEEYLMQRGMLRSASTGRLLDEAWLVPHVPTYWCYDVLRGLDHLRAAGVRPDARVDEAVESVRRARRADGTWTATVSVPARQVLELEREGGPSAIITARAQRVLEWAEA